MGIILICMKFCSTSRLVNQMRRETFLSSLNKPFLQLLQERTDRIMEMAGVMSQSIQIDDGFLAREEEIRSRLVTENKVRARWMSEVHD